VEPVAILVLGGRLRVAGRPSATLARRIAEGARAARRWPNALVVACGGRAWHGFAEADVIARELERQGIARERIARDRLSLDTVENLREGAALARARGLGVVALVTCDWHLPRACAIAEAMSIEAIGVPAASPPVSAVRARLRALSEAMHRAIDVRRARLA
jgi:uncharacterized SAM-binding protein YcdF (DUF218 family)